MNAIDTNIWIYTHDPRDPQKQAVAQKLVGQVRPLALPWQVGCEFLAAARKLAAYGFSEDKAWLALAAMQSMADKVLFPDSALWPLAESLTKRFSLSVWDALLVAACLVGGVQTLHTEDMGGTARIDTLAVVNPFVAVSP